MPLSSQNSSSALELLKSDDMRLNYLKFPLCPYVSEIPHYAPLISKLACIPGITPMKLQDHISFFLVEETIGFLFQWRTCTSV